MKRVNALTDQTRLFIYITGFDFFETLLVMDFDEHKTGLTEANSLAYTQSYFALRVKKEDVFSEDMIKAYKPLTPALSCLDNRIMWLPAGLLAPNFYWPNKIYHKTFMGRHRDSEMPIVMCVSNVSLGPEMARIYEDTDVVKTQNDLLNSLVSHTTEEFSNEVPDRVDSTGCVEETLDADNEVLLVYDTVKNLIHRLGNNDTQLGYTEETPCSSEKTIGKNAFRVISMLSCDKKGSEKYTSTKKRHPFALATGPVIMREFRHLIRIMLKFGKGDTGTSKDNETDAQDTLFEENMLAMVAKNPPQSGPGALGLVSSFFPLTGVTNTITKNNRKYVMDACHTAAWSLMAVCNLSAFSAPTISYLSTSEKGLKYHTKTANPLTNLQFTVAKESRTYTGLILYLAKRTCQVKCPKSTLKSVIYRSQQCESCNVGENCAMSWVCTMNESRDISASLTDSKKSSVEGPSSHFYYQLFLSEYNDQATVMGSASSDKIRGGRQFIEAYKKILDHAQSTLNIPKDGTSITAMETLGAALIKTQDFIVKGEYKTVLLHRSQYTKDKLETVLTDNEGGVQKMPLGLISIPLFRSKVLTYIARFAYHVNFKLAEFTQKPAQGLSDAHSAVASKNAGVYCAKKDQEQISMKTYYIHPSKNQETGEVYDINTTPKVSSVTVDQVNLKMTSKIKMLNGIIKKDCDGGGGMAFGVKPDILANTQRDSIKSAINWILLKLCPKFNPARVSKSMDGLIDTLLAQPLSIFNADELLVNNWKSFLDLFIMGSLMVANQFEISPSRNYCGVTVPKFAYLESAKKVTLEPISLKFLMDGPTLVYAKTKVDSFKTKAPGEKTTFVSCTMAKFNSLRQFVGSNLLSLSNTTMAGVFIPLKSDYKSVTETDEICTEFSLMANISKAERCERLFKHAHAIMAKIRDINCLEEDEVITYDHAESLFLAYNAQIMLNDDDIKDMVMNITDSDYMAAVCKRVAKEEEVEEEEEAIDFNAMMATRTVVARESDVLAEFADD